jgi:probable phosphoglycerate mutase
MELYFVRHGQTDFNIAKRLQGQEIDTSLNDEGREQVEVAAANLPKGVTMLVSSPLKRAYESAEIINRVLNLPIITRDEIKEIAFGSLAGKTWNEIEAETGDMSLRSSEANSNFDFRPFGGEFHEDVRRRVRSFIEELQSKHQGEVILVVAHGGMIRMMHELYPQKELPVAANASIHEFVF